MFVFKVKTILGLKIDWLKNIQKMVSSKKITPRQGSSEDAFCVIFTPKSETKRLKEKTHESERHGFTSIYK